MAVISNRKSVWAALAVVCALWVAPAAFAQDQGGGAGGAGGNGGGNRGGGRGNFDPAQMRERMMNFYKERLGATDDEWKVLSPKIEKVMTAQRETRGGGMGGFGGRGGRGGGQGGDNQPTTAMGKASAELRTALDNKDTPADQINAKLTALREAREKARAEVTAAQKELKEVLTPRQEAVLVSMGMLE